MKKTNNNILEIKDLVKDYGSFRAVDNVSFNIKEGEIFGLLGPNGAGKTTVISSIMTLVNITKGEIFVDGLDISKQSRVAKSIIGYMPQELITHGYFNVLEIVKFYSGFCGVVPDFERIEYLLKKLSLWDQRYSKVRSLSGGMKRRLLMVKALVHKPKLLLLDEPTAGVDINLRNTIWKFVKDLRKEGASILFTTHYLEEAEKLCDRVAFMHKGKISHVGTTNELISTLTARKIAIKSKAEEAPVHKNYIGLENGYHAFHLPYSAAVGDFLKETSIDPNNVLDIKMKEGSLEDVFQLVFEGKKQ